MVRLLALILFLTLSLNTSAADTEFKQNLDNALSAIKEEHQIPAVSIAIIASGEIVYQQGFGFLDKDKTEPVTESSLFRTASLSKIFTAQAIMQLVEREKISLDDKVAQYLPQFNDSPITIRHLLTHSSGLSDKVGPLPVDKKRSLETYLNHLSEQAVDVKPGNSFEYSDGGFNILGAIVSTVSDMRFEDYITKNIFLPTDMRQSGYFDGKQGIKAEALPTYEGKVLNKEQFRPYDVAFYPSEGLVSNVADLSRWLVSTLTLSEKVLTKDSYQSMLQPQLKTTWGEIYMGLGWQVYEKNGPSVARHPGSIRGYKALIISFPESQDAMIILSNAHETPRWDIARVIREILTEQKVW